MIWKFESAKPNSEMSVLRPFLSRLNKRTTIFHGLYSCTLIDHRNDVQMFKTQVEPRAADEWFHSNVLNILTSFLWSISVQTIENCCRLFFYNNSHCFFRPFPLKFLGKSRAQEREKQIEPPSRHFHGLYSYPYR